jgi:hypothetical protein
MLGMAAKNSTASSTSICSTSPMLLPRQVAASVSGLKRAPLQVSQGTFTSGRKAHADGADALAFAAGAAAFAGVEAEAARPSRARALPACRQTACGSCPRSRCRWPGSCAAFCRWASGPPPARGRWRCQPSTLSQPVHCGAPRLPTAACTLASSTSRASVDLPEPDTPVTATRRLSGTITFTLGQVVQRGAFHLELLHIATDRPARLLRVLDGVQQVAACHRIGRAEMSPTEPWPPGCRRACRRWGRCR